LTHTVYQSHSEPFVIEELRRNSQFSTSAQAYGTAWADVCQTETIIKDCTGTKKELK